MKHKTLDMRRQINLLFFTFTFLLFVSCKHEDLNVYVESEHYRNAADFTANNYDLSLFHAALETAGLLDTLSGKGPFTVFAPKNQAFNDLGIVRATDFLKMDRDSLRFMLQYHILPRWLYTSDVSQGTIDNRHTNLVGKELFVGRATRYGVSTLYVSGAASQSTTQDVVLANGVLHVINKVLKYNESTVQHTLQNRSEFSLFVEMLQHFGEWDRLAESGPWTVMAPTNEAFKKRGVASADIQQMAVSAYNKEMLLRPYLLKNHVFTSDMDVVGYSDAGANLGDMYVLMPVDGADDYISGINIRAGFSSKLAFVSEKNPPEIYSGYYRQASFGGLWETDYKTENGIVHAIDDLLVYPEDAIKK